MEDLKMLVKELKKQLKGQYAIAEVYRYTDSRKRIHTDYIKSVGVDENEDNLVVDDYEIMNAEDYDNTVLANSSLSSNDFDDDVFPTLVIMVND
jgi:hypothetical protein